MFTIEVAEEAEEAYAEELRETETRFPPILYQALPPFSKYFEDKCSTSVYQVFSHGQTHTTKSVSRFLEVESTPVIPSETKPCRRHLLKPICRGGGKLVLRCGGPLQNKSLVIQIKFLVLANGRWNKSNVIKADSSFPESFKSLFLCPTPLGPSGPLLPHRRENGVC